MENPAAYDEVVDFLASGATPSQIVEFVPSTELLERVEDLIRREKNEGLVREEKFELDCCMTLEHIMRMAKIHARRRLQQKS